MSRPVVTIGDRTFTVTVVPVVATGTSRKLLSGSGVVLSWNWAEPTGTAAGGVQLYDGGDTTGVPILHVRLAQGTSESGDAGPYGVPFDVGLYADVTTGEVDGTVVVGREGNV